MEAAKQEPRAYHFPKVDPEPGSRSWYFFFLSQNMDNPPTSTIAVQNFVADYVLMLICALLAYAIERIEPHQSLAFLDSTREYDYPMSLEDTIPPWTLPLLCFGVPLLFVLFVGRYRRHDTWMYMMAILGKTLIDNRKGVCVASSTTYMIVSILKVSVGRLRPDFRARCQPDTAARSPHIRCTGKSADVLNGRKSFPSGHTATGFAGMGYSSLYIGAQLRLFNQKRTCALKVILFLMPWMLAVLIGVTRMTDYRHHPTDVIAGAILGTIVAILAYRVYFPSLLDGQDPFEGYKSQGEAPLL
jgi:diacylglycerol diphosphate phosphatase/phosphatidate phosphatase